MSESSVKPVREPAALSVEYHKARKQLMLWAGVLLLWELVGVDLEKAKESGGNVGAIISAIKSPQAVPWALIILVGYFLFRFTVEWNQSNQSRRLLRWAKVDFTAAWIVSLGAYALYFGQTISQVQFADLLQSSNKYQSLSAGFVGGVLVILGLFFWKSQRYSDMFPMVRAFPVFLVLLGILFLPLGALGGKFPMGINWKFGLVGMISGIIALSLLLQFLSGKVTNKNTG
jgi:hypothetical protein